MDEAEVKRILKRWATADDAFREELLQRCLTELGRGSGAKLADDDLELLAAAGDDLPTWLRSDD